MEGIRLMLIASIPPINLRQTPIEMEGKEARKLQLHLRPRMELGKEWKIIQTMS